MPLIQTFATAAAAADRAARTAFSSDIVVMPGPPGRHLKRRMPPGVEPLYLCGDGRWRRYDLIEDLPHSSAAHPPR